jgi:Arc/MetJ family transcription regulator
MQRSALGGFEVLLMHCFVHQNEYTMMHTEVPMRTTINLDTELVDTARKVSGLTERTALIHEGLRALIQRESARRLARLGGSEPGLRPPPRRRTDAT